MMMAAGIDGEPALVRTGRQAENHMLIITSKKNGNFLSSIASNTAHNNLDSAAVIKKDIVTLLYYSGTGIVKLFFASHG